MRNSRVKWAQWMRDINKDLTDMSVCACRGSYWSRWSVRARWTMQLMSWWSYCRVHCLIYHSSAQCVAMNNWSATACISYRLVCLNAESLIKLATHTDTHRHTHTDRQTDCDTVDQFDMCQRVFGISSLSEEKWVWKFWWKTGTRRKKERQLDRLTDRQTEKAIGWIGLSV